MVENYVLIIKKNILQYNAICVIYIAPTKINSLWPFTIKQLKFKTKKRENLLNRNTGQIKDAFIPLSNIDREEELNNLVNCNKVSCNSQCVM